MRHGIPVGVLSGSLSLFRCFTGSPPVAEAATPVASQELPPPENLTSPDEDIHQMKLRDEDDAYMEVCDTVRTSTLLSDSEDEGDGAGDADSARSVGAAPVPPLPGNLSVSSPTDLPTVAHLPLDAAPSSAPARGPATSLPTLQASSGASSGLPRPSKRTAIYGAFDGEDFTDNPMEASDNNPLDAGCQVDDTTGSNADASPSEGGSSLGRRAAVHRRRAMRSALDED